VDSLTWVYAGMIWATATGAMGQTLGGQNPIPDVNGGAELVVFFSGRVVLDGGFAPPDPVRIERVCDGRTTFEAWTDEKGHFSFKVDSESSDKAAGDATEPAAQAAELNRPTLPVSRYTIPVTSALRNCELQAVLPGFQSERVSMAIETSLADTRVGTIILHPLSRANALTISATTLEAPTNARKAYEKGLAAMREQKWDVAAGEFTKAVNTYAKYAMAWYELGRARQNRNDPAGARDAWKAAQRSDPKYVKPYEGLTVLAERCGDWAESAQYSRAWIQLDPEEFPAAYLFNALANARLNKMEEAERAAREGVRVDKDHKIPRLNYVLGVILMEKHEYSESEKCLRTFLGLMPNAKDAAVVREQLVELEKFTAASPPR
jgi:tetratricopeptide (TPR) repeat protein